MKRFFTLLFLLSMAVLAIAQGWPANYGGVMLQGFYWNSQSDTQWTRLESQADELAAYFSLIWVPQSGKCLNANSMGYDPYYFFDHNSAFGTQTELKSMISTFKSKGLGTIADVVINHHNSNGWFGFPSETWNGNTYQLQSTDIVADDDGGATKTQADKEGVSLSQNNDEGEGWSGCRDLDHKSSNVQTVVKAYEKFLVSELGYSGFRYDMVKGFSGTHVADYNDAAGVEYSVGEYWDGNSSIENWINTTSKKSAAFDFQFRYNIRDAINGNNWAALNSTNNLIHDSGYRQYAVTFVENHDTEKRSDASQDPIAKDTLAANAYLLAMPGTPCVFYKHWADWKQEIKAMIDARRVAGITNTSTYSNETATAQDFINNVKGTNATLTLRINSLTPIPADKDNSRTLILSGKHYAYYLSNSAEVAFVDKASGEYDNAFTATLTAVSATSGAQLVYTLDGTTPTATNGSKVASGTQLKISENCTLTVGLLVNGTVVSTTQRTYTISEFKPYTISVYVNADNAGAAWAAAYTTATSPTINYHTWGGDGSHGTSWPGKKVTKTATVGGKKWLVNDYTINTKTDYVSFVFSVGTGTPQTVDITGFTKDAFIEITSTTTGGKYTCTDVTANYATGIYQPSLAEMPTLNAGIYAIDGRKISDGADINRLPKGVYIVNGRKIAKTK